MLIKLLVYSVNAFLIECPSRRATPPMKVTAKMGEIERSMATFFTSVRMDEAAAKEVISFLSSHLYQ